MSLPQPPGTIEATEQPAAKATGRRRIPGILLAVLILLVIAGVWQFLNARANNNSPLVAGRPLSNPQTHLHTIALGGERGVLYLGTHFGLFKSRDGGNSWPQTRGSLDSLMITSIAVSSFNQNVLAVIAIPRSGIGQPSGVYLSSDGGNSWHFSGPSGLSLSAYPFTVRAGSENEGHFYAFYDYAGWFETRDMGVHWHQITSGLLSNMQTPSLLTNPTAPNSLLLGGDQGLFETQNDGQHWHQILSGNISSLVASNTTPRSIFCTSDQGMYSWKEGSKQFVRVQLPQGTSLTRLVLSSNGKFIYGMSGQDLWYSGDGGATWKQRWHFEWGDLISLVIDPQQPDHLYAGFFLPALVMYSSDGGNSWQTLTN